MNTEINFLVDLRAAAKSQKHLAISATPDQCLAVAKRLDILEISDFKTTFIVDKKASGIYAVKGHTTSHLIQACVRTLAPVPEAIDDQFEVTFMREDIFEQRPEEDDDQEVEDIEILGDEMVDLGEIAVQYLSLAMDPFPTSEGELEVPDFGDKVAFISEEDHKVKSSPFATLKKTHKNKEDG